VICDLLGVPDADRPHLRTWTAGMLGGSADAVAAFETYLRGLIATKRTTPADDLITAMVAARDEDDRLSEDELTSLAFLTLLAGYENSVNLIGNCILLLLQRPRLLAEVRADERLRRAAVEETLRFEPPAILALRRFARESLTYGDVTIPAGATVLLSLAAANRDPAAVEDPDEFRLRVPPAPHVGLGYGPHYCFGAALALLSAEVAAGTLLEQFPQVTLADPAAPPAWRSSMRTRALSELPVVLTP
jgi:cytochrome P450